MGQRCVLRGCKNKGKNTDVVRYHRFPRDPDMKKKWEEYVSLHNDKVWTAYKSAVICSVHFLPEQYLNGALLPESLPSIPAEAPPPTKINPLVPVKSVASASVESVDCLGESEPSCSVESIPSVQVESDSSIAIPPSVEVNFMGVPVLANSLLNVAPNVLIKVMDQQPLPSTQHSVDTSSNSIHHPSFLGVGNEEHEAAVASISEVPDERKQSTETDPLVLYGDLSQFIIFKTNTSASVTTDELSNQNDNPSQNGHCEGNGLKSELNSSLIPGFNAANNLKIHVDFSTQTAITAVNEVKSLANTLPQSLTSVTNNLIKSQSDSLTNADVTAESFVKSETGPAPAGLTSSTSTAMHSDPPTAEQDCASVTITAPALKISQVEESHVRDNITNGNIVGDENVMETSSNEMCCSIETSSDTTVLSRKRHISLVPCDNDDMTGKKFKMCPGEMQPEDFESPTSRVHNLSRLKDIINDKNQLLDNTQRTVQMLTERLKDLESLLNRLKEDTHISGYVRNIIREDFPQLDKP